MSGPSNIWVSRFDGLDDLALIRARTWLKVEPLLDIESQPTLLAAERLRNAMSEVFYPTDRACELMRDHVQRAQAFALKRYPRWNSFLDEMTPEEVAGAPHCWCLTGPAGIGKTALMAALVRLVPPTTVFLTEQHPSQPTTAFRRLAANTKTTDVQMLTALANPAALGPAQRIKRPTLEEHVRAWFKLTGVAGLCPDELQFVTQSAQANVRVAQLLTTMSHLGVPLTFVANYSLVHKLKKRPPEERQRLLAGPKVLLPDAPDSECWRNVLKAQLDVAPESFDLDFTAHAEDLHRYSGGLKRVLRELLVLAFQIAHTRARSRRVGKADVREAYLSQGFSVNREDVEAMIAAPLTGSNDKRRRLDLINPFEAVGESGGVRRKQVTPREERVAEQVLHGALSRNERLALADLQRAADKNNGRSASDVVVPLRRQKAPPLTVQSLLEGSAAATRRSARRKGAEDCDDEGG